MNDDLTGGSAPTTPTQPAFHGSLPPRGLSGTPSSTLFQGRFGRMFRNLPACEVEDASLVKLGQAMIQDLEEGKLDKPLGEPDEDENTAELSQEEQTDLDGKLRLPAGYTYFGQFVDHDITFDPVSSLTRQNDPDGLADFRTPRFDLDSLYGRGPSDQPYMYEEDGVHLRLGLKLSQDQTSEDPTAGPDLLRSNGRALIGDPRNDENTLVSQLQVTFIRFHNAVVDKVGTDPANGKRSPDEIFKLAQQQVRWHYQWVVIHDFLRRLVGKDVIEDILHPAPYKAPAGGDVFLPDPKRRFFTWEKEPYMPVEFSVAAYRFGHSIVRPSYLINTEATTDPHVENAARIPLFSQEGGPKQSLNGFRTVPDNWAVQWSFLLPGIHDGVENPHLPQPGYKLDAQLSHPLGALPSSTAGPAALVAGFEENIAQDLAVRNLLRGRRLDLPSGQDVAEAMGIPPLSDAELFDGVEVDQTVKDDFAGRAPLWFYILKEAEKRADSAGLGPVGGRIVAEVLIGLLEGDPLSYLNVKPHWTPTLGPTEGKFTLSDLVNFAIPAPGQPAPSPYNPG
ncbi:MAG TPA: heme peroxidase family protein [Solirubrobacterales bacterium]|nr:heme peroxidase family protein [Solirubrobacterales bacterium]